MQETDKDIFAKDAQDYLPVFNRYKIVLDHGEVLGEVRLQIAGIMSEEPLVDVNRELENAKEKAFALGVSRGVDPFMTLSFMALPVIPTLRLTTRGVFDTVTQKYV